MEDYEDGEAGGVCDYESREDLMSGEDLFIRNVRVERDGTRTAPHLRDETTGRSDNMLICPQAIIVRLPRGDVEMAGSPFVSTIPHPPDQRAQPEGVYRSSSTITTSVPLFRRLRGWSLELGAVRCSSNFNDYKWSLEAGCSCSLNLND